MSCSWVVKYQGPPCGEDSEFVSNLNLCSEHREVLRERWDSKGKQAILRSVDYHPFEAFPGVCYIALMPDGYIKIGYSSTEKLYTQRMKSLSRQAGSPVIPLAKVPGGFVAETVLHERFREHRIKGPGERFRHSPELAEYIASL